VSAAAGRMFEDPEPLRFSLVRDPWSFEQQSSGPVQISQVIYFFLKQSPWFGRSRAELNFADMF
jgi:hypothetical protein